VGEWESPGGAGREEHEGTLIKLTDTRVAQVGGETRIIKKGEHTPNVKGNLIGRKDAKKRGRE